MPAPKVIKRTTTTVEEFLDVETSAEDTELDGVEEQDDDGGEEEEGEEEERRPARKRRA